MTLAQDCPHAPVSWGELLDKITILQIKRERIASPVARANVQNELNLLRAVAGDAMRSAALAPLMGRLRRVNEELWKIEDAIREREAEEDFGASFIELARSVYRQNDLRAAIKRQINDLLGSALIEEKSYAGWASPA